MGGHGQKNKQKLTSRSISVSETTEGSALTILSKLVTVFYSSSNKSCHKSLHLTLKHNASVITYLNHFLILWLEEYRSRIKVHSLPC